MEVWPEERGEDWPVLVRQLRLGEDVALEVQEIFQEVVRGITQGTLSICSMLLISSACSRS